MKLIFERSVPGRHCTMPAPCRAPQWTVPEKFRRADKPDLPEVSETELSRHYTELAKQTYGVNDGFYPLGSCTMKYNPAANETAAALEGFTAVHPLQPEDTVRGCAGVLCEAGRFLSEVTGMDRFTFQPAAGAHGELTGMLVVKAYHAHRGDAMRTKVLVPDSAHGTNPATAVMCGFEVVNLPSNGEGGVDLDALKAAVGPDTAGLMLTNPNTLGIFDPNILEITRIVHEAGGLCYYDGANLNAVMGVARPGDMGFDVVHLNLHKTFSTPHGGGGPGAGAVGVREALAPFLPETVAGAEGNGCGLETPGSSIGRVRAFHANFLVVVRALCYMYMLGGRGLREASVNAVLNANYLKSRLTPYASCATGETCMHEFVLSLQDLKQRTGVSAMDIAKGMLDRGMHAPTMYFPLIVHEALMFEPTETESREMLDEAADAVIDLIRSAETEPEKLHRAPEHTPIGRPDEVLAARKPRIRWTRP